MNKRINGLDGLRFVSISFVIILHLFTFKSNFGFDTIYFPVIELLGGIYPVQFFFTLSGFLLTYILLKELEKYRSIDIKNFYIKRVLRIWPAYLLLILAALLLAINIKFFNIPGITESYQTNGKLSTAFFFLFLPHLAPQFGPTAPYIHHTYTIGIEEQFYLLWGMLFFIFKRRIIYVLILIFLCSPIINVLHDTLYQSTLYSVIDNPALIFIKKALFYFQYSKISTFTIGSLFGYAFFYKYSWIEYFYNKKVQVVVYLILLMSILFNIQPMYFAYEYIALITSCIILMSTNASKSLINFGSQRLSALGQISYGIYLFHIFSIVLSIKFLSTFFHFSFDSFFELSLLCIVTLLLATLFGSLSYNYFEIYFLKLKKHFNRI